MLILHKLIIKFGEKFKFMSAQIIRLNIQKLASNANRPLLSMFMVRRHEKFKVITNLAQLTPQELVAALVRDAVCSEREQAAVRKIAEY